MKKVLIITYYWPPSGGGGVQRWLKFTKYLPQFGWEPVIYTPEIQYAPASDPGLLKDVSPDLTLIRKPIWEPYGLYKSFTGRKVEENTGAAFTSGEKTNHFLEDIANMIRSNFFIPDARMFWIRPSIKFLRKYIQTQNIAAIITTGPPHSMHLIGMKLKKHLSIPWIADFRDPWTEIDYYDQLKLSTWANRRHHRLEQEVLTHADLVISVSESNKNGFLQKADVPIEVITNGFDEDDQPTIIPALDEKFTISHIGTFMANRNPEVLWKALAEILKENEDFKSDLELHLVGKTDHLILQSIEKNELLPFVRISGQVNHDEAIKLQRQSQLLLILVNKTGDSKGMVTGKVFEYIASGRPILAIGPTDGDLAKILKDTATGVISAFDDNNTLKVHIKEFYNLYKTGSLAVNAQNPERYSRKNLTKRLADLLKKTTE